MMEMNKGKTRLLTIIPPWIFIGAVIVLLPIAAFMAIENIHRQRENSTRLLLEKGAALIRSFEAGTRTGLMGEFWSARELQNLLVETALQPDIAYIFVVNANGIILAHNDVKNIGRVYGSELNLRQLVNSTNLKWQLVSHPEGENVFEVVRRFSPTGMPAGMPMRGRHFGGRRQNTLKMFRQLCRPHMRNWENVGLSEYIIFVGLKTDTMIEAEKTDTRHAVIMSGIMLLIGFAGIIILFFTHNYRVTKASLSKIKAFSDNLVENMPIGLVALDAGERVASCNHVAESILGFSSGIIIEKHASEILPKQLVSLLDNLETSSGVVEKEIDCEKKDGETIPLEASATRLYDENKTFLGYVLLFKDLTEIRSLKKVIARNQRLASIGRLAAGVAHEIRNPLSSIKGFATYFRERYSDNPEDQQTAGIMIQEVERLNRVVGQLLEFSKPVHISPKPADVKTIIIDSLRLIEKNASEKHIRIEKNFPEESMVAEVDADRLSQVFLNLYLNAMEAMESNGTISVELMKHEVKDGISVRVSDTGTGISKENLANIFDPYFTTKSSGTGLGLAIVHNIIESHNGDIHVESTPGQGCIFTIFIPRRVKDNSNEG